MDVINDRAGLKKKECEKYIEPLLRLRQKLKGVNWEDEIKLGVVHYALPFKYRYTTMP